MLGFRTRARAGVLEISLAVATATRMANRVIIVMDEAVMVVMLSRGLLWHKISYTTRGPFSTRCMASDPLVGAWTPYASFSVDC